MNREHIVSELVKMGWSRETLALAEEMEFKCAYCGRDFLAGVDDYYSFQVDHIVPRGIGEETPENKTVACSTCNYLKRRRDPRNDAGLDGSRAELIAAAREYVMSVREQKAQKVARERELAAALLAAKE